MKLFDILFISNDRRIRAGWRLLMQLVLSGLLIIIFQLSTSAYGGRTIQIIAGGMAITLAVWISGLVFDKRPMRDFGLKLDARWWWDCLVGCLMATLVMSIIVLVQWLFGWLEFTGFGWNRSSERSFILLFSGYILTMAVVGFYEELWFRGYQVKNLTEGFFTGDNRNIAGIGAIAISSLFFGLLHLGNPNSTLFGMFVIVLAGIMLSLPFVITGQLGYSIGLHFAWNTVQGALYGLPVSGIYFRQSILQFEVIGPETWTGGRFGPEGGLIGIIGVLLLIVMTVIRLRNQGYAITITEELTRTPSSTRY